MNRLISLARNKLSRATSQPSSFSFLVTRKRNTESSQRHSYHPVHPGDILSERYRIQEKIGWGQYSTVWLVEDIQVEQRQAAVKILVSELTNDKTGWDETGILKLIRQQNPDAAGYRHICHLLDDFVVQGPNGSHICLVTELMGPTALDLYRCAPSNLPLPVVKRIAKHVLLALQYMHESCQLVHTDIKGDNIFMSDGPPTPSFPDAIRIKEEQLMSTTFKLGDFGSTNPLSNKYARLIQPEALRSPEVIVGAEWDVKADIWNFGCLIYEFARGAQLFDPHWNNEESGMNPPETHLAQIFGLVGGDIPREWIFTAKYANRYFDSDGRLLRGNGLYNTTLEELLRRADHNPEELSLIADFLSLALAIDPSKRWSAAQLLHHPWMKGA